MSNYIKKVSINLIWVIKKLSQEKRGEKHKEYKRSVSWKVNTPQKHKDYKNSFIWKVGRPNKKKHKETKRPFTWTVERSNEEYKKFFTW